MKFDIITIFPNIFGSYFSESIIGRAKKEGLIKMVIHNLREFTDDERRTVDDTPYGGGAGMVLKIEPIYKCLQSIKKLQPKADPPRAEKTRKILFSAKGKRFTQADVVRLSEYENIIMICGRYEGVDERVAENLVDEEISIGDYVLTGGEIPAMVLVDAISRHIPGVLGNPNSLEEESFNNKLKTKNKELKTELEYPQYTKPENFNDWKVPEILLSGNHEKIEKWRKAKSKNK